MHSKWIVNNEFVKSLKAVYSAFFVYLIYKFKFVV